MNEACVSCGEDDDLLFTCQYCEEQFCAPHQFPHHACSRFRRTDTEASRGDDPTAESAEATGSDDASSDPEPEPQRARVSTTTQARGAPGTATPTGGGVSEGTVRSMDTERAVGVVSGSSGPGTLGEWLSRQTYVTLFVKVGLIAFLVNAAFYGGLALTLYDPLGWGLGL